MELVGQLTIFSLRLRWQAPGAMLGTFTTKSTQSLRCDRHFIAVSCAFIDAFAVAHIAEPSFLFWR
jgi:hypothetical protein